VAKRVLIAYETGAGATTDVAEEIGRAIGKNGDVEAVVRRVSDVHDLGGNDAVVVGSAIRAGKWLGGASRFVETNQDDLRGLPVAYFVVCLTMKDPTEENCATVEAYLDPQRTLVEPVSVGLFAGAMQLRKLPLPLRLIMKMMKAEEGDFRDWEAIRAWGGSLRSDLLGIAG